MAQGLIQPRTLKGFRDYPPSVMMPREQIMDIARRVYRRYGFSPIDTPALEYLEILTGKGSEETDRQLYRFEDHGGRKVGLRFDLTVPLARFAAQHIQQLGTPFKRYHIAPVWRGESPQAGRFREFLQCDFDTIGTESVAADIETALVIHDLLTEIGITNFVLRINTRQLLNGLLEKHGLQERATPVLRALDKLDKIGAAGVLQELSETAQVSVEQSEAILGLASIHGSVDQVLSQVADLVQGSEKGEAGVERLYQITGALKQLGIAPERYRIDVAIARGLDYYTGVIYETTLTDLPAMGSVCSGGRYDNLAELYTKQHLPGIGASLGIDRLLAAMEQLGMLPAVHTPAAVFIPYFDADRLASYLQLARVLRNEGLGVEVYPDPKKLGAQLKYAVQRGFPVAVIAGSRELEAGLVQVKDLRTKQASEVPWSVDAPQPLVDLLKNLLGRAESA
ncbi:MAG: histidine--tRNA ligase [Pirellulaceae bacterium]|nr:MAG: histidine--tRNA ligase [Pirellulaceae bacterium]